MCMCDPVIPILKALGDETRLSILVMLEEGEKCACRIQDAFACTQPTISYHMRILTESGLVRSRRDGALMCYELNSALWEAVCALKETIHAQCCKEGNDNE